MKLRSTLLLAALAALVPLVAATAARPTAPAGPNVATAAAKSCRYVIRRIHGRRRRVRVCRRRSPVVARIDVGTDAWTVAAADDGGVWSEGAGGVVRIDPKTNRISLRTRFDGGPSAGAGSIWVASARTLRRLNPRTGQLQGAIPLPHEAVSQPLVAAGSAWIPTGEQDADWYLTRVDVASNTVTADLPGCDVHGYGATFADDSVWLACFPEGEVVRIDARTNRVQARIRLATGVHSLTAGAGSVWANNHETGRLSRIDVATNRVVASLSTGSNVAIVFARGKLWASGDAAVLRIDPATNRVTGRLPVGYGDYYGLAYSAGSFWLSTIGDQRILRLDPRRIRPA
jgi:virginiamycin B lyase